MPVSFDDLIPDASPPQGVVTFDDLVPANQTASAFNNATPTAAATRLAAMGGSNALEGAAQTLGIPGDIANLYDKYVGGPFARVATGQSPAFGQPPAFGLSNATSAVLPNSQALVSSLKDAGLVQRSDLKPQSAGERYFASAAKGMGSAGPLAPLAGGPMAAAQMIAQGAGGGVGQQAAEDILPGNQTASLLASIGGGGVSSSGLATGERAVNSVLGNSSPLLQAYETSGITPRLVGDVSQNPAMQKLQALGDNQKAVQQTLGEFGDSVENLAGGLGQSRTLQEAGTSLQNSGQSWLNQWKQDNKSAWDNVNSLIPPTTPLQPVNLKNSIDTITGQAQNNQSLNDILKSPIVQKSINVLQDGSGALTWGQAAALRTHIGQMLDNPAIVSGPEQAQAKMLYGGLTQDMQQAAASTGNPGASNAFKVANDITSSGHDFIDGTLNKIMKADPERAASSVLSGGAFGGTQLQMIRQQLPDAADELAAVSLRRAMAGQSEGAAGNAVSPSRWLSTQDPTRRLSPEAFNALYPDPGVRGRMSALDMVADNMRTTEKLANHSNTAMHMGPYAALLSAGEGARIGHEMAGIPGMIAGGAIGGGLPFAVAPAASMVTTNPAIARFMGAPVTRAPFGLVPSLLPQVGQ